MRFVRTDKRRKCYFLIFGQKKRFIYLPEHYSAVIDKEMRRDAFLDFSRTTRLFFQCYPQRELLDFFHRNICSTCYLEEINKMVKMKRIDWITLFQKIEHIHNTQTRGIHNVLFYGLSRFEFLYFATFCLLLKQKTLNRLKDSFQHCFVI